MKYFIIINDEQFGPFSIEEIKAKNLSNTTPIWHEGLSTWKQILDLEEFKETKVNLPPKFQIEEKTITSPKNPQSQAILKEIETRELQNKKKQENIKSVLPFIWIGLSAAAFIGIVIYFTSSSDYEDHSFNNQSNSDEFFNSEEGSMNHSNSDSSTSKTNEEVISSTINHSNKTNNSNTNSIKKSDEQIYHEQEEQLFLAEKSNPKKYLEVDATYRVNLAANTVIEGSIFNNASVASFKNITLQVQFFSETDYLLGTREFVILQSVYPGDLIQFKQKITGWWDNVSYFTCKVKTAEIN